MRPATGVLVASAFASAFLLFLVQPMVARMALPWFGGGTAVWSTCLVFFQTLLLAGYAYAHASVRRLGDRRQLALHLVVLLAPLAALPHGLGARHAPAPGAWPVPALLAALAAAVGLPFFALATHGTLAQRWYALAGARDPYALYAASNAGSLAALVAYPLAVEPRLALAAQARLFAAGYAAFVALALAAMALAWRGAAAAAPATATAPAPATPLAWGARARWLLRAAVTSLVLVAVTARVTADVASVPLLWTAPLALYLLSWVLAFAPRVPFPRPLLVVAALYGVTFSMHLWPLTHVTALALLAGPPLVALFLGSWVVHADLARDRPPADRLTDFYLHTAAGGCLGGLAGALAAPLAFATFAEYPLALFLLALALLAEDPRGPSLRAALARPRHWVGPGLAAVALAVAEVQLRRGAPPVLAWHAAPMALLVAALALWRVPALYVGVCGLVAALAASGAHGDGRTLATARSFFGVLRVREADGWRALSHGTTLHGIQRVAPPSATPGTYYHPHAPMGAAVAAAPPGAAIGVVGLGAGSLAALLDPGQRLTFYEIDPAVEPLARRHFTFLGASRGRVDVVLGDARQTLARAPAAGLDLLVVDAFASDAVPVHLLTVEAVALYLARVGPRGVVLLHVSHRHLDLARVVAGAARRVGARAAVNDWSPDEAAQREGARGNTVVALARAPEPLAALPGGGWRPLAVAAPVAWTDARSSLLDVLGR